MKDGKINWDREIVDVKASRSVRKKPADVSSEELRDIQEAYHKAVDDDRALAYEEKRVPKSFNIEDFFPHWTVADVLYDCLGIYQPERTSEFSLHAAVCVKVRDKVPTLDGKYCEFLAKVLRQGTRKLKKEGEVEKSTDGFFVWIINQCLDEIGQLPKED